MLVASRASSIADFRCLVKASVLPRMYRNQSYQLECSASSVKKLKQTPFWIYTLLLLLIIIIIIVIISVIVIIITIIVIILLLSLLLSLLF